jgi:hypothetical protein
MLVNKIQRQLIACGDGSNYADPDLLGNGTRSLCIKHVAQRSCFDGLLLNIVFAPFRFHTEILLCQECRPAGLSATSRHAVVELLIVGTAGLLVIGTRA